MTKLLHSALVLAVAATAASAMAAETTLHFDDFGIKKGQEKVIEIYVDNPDYVFSAMQFDIELAGGLKLKEDEDGNAYIDPVPQRIPGYTGTRYQTYTPSGSWQADGSYRFLFYNSRGLQVTGTSGALLTITVEADDTFGNTNQEASITLKNIRISDYNNSSTSNKLSTHTSHAYLSKPLTEATDRSFEGKKCFIDDAVKVVATGTNAEGTAFAFVTDGNGQWLKVLMPNGNHGLSDGQFIAANELSGTLSNCGTNPTLTIEDNRNYTEPTTDINYEIKHFDLRENNLDFNLQPNEVAYFLGHYFIQDDGTPGLSQWSGETGGHKRGRVIDVCTDYLTTIEPGAEGISTTELTPGVPYNFNMAAVQLKVAWETLQGAPLKVQPSEANSYTNLVIYPIVVQDGIITGVNDLSSKATVSSVRYYNTAGIESATPFSGVNIVVTTMSDGTTTTTKVIK